jgi:hypothetical protein
MNIKVAFVLFLLGCVNGELVATDEGRPIDTGRGVGPIDAEGLSALNVDLLRELVCCVDEDERFLDDTMLTGAVFGGDTDTIRALVYFGEDLNARQSFGDPICFHGAKSPFHKDAAVISDTMYWLLRLGAHFNLVDKHGRTLMEALDDCKKRIVMDAVTRFERSEAICVEPLFSAAMRRRATERLFQFLAEACPGWVKKSALVAGADCSARSEDGDTVLHKAVGVATFERRTSAPGERPVVYSKFVQPPSIRILQLLIQNGAPLFAVNRAGKTAEQVARDNGFIEAADFLAEEMKKAAKKRWSSLRAAWVGAVGRAS